MFWLQSKNRHGIHSPFVYGFLDQGLYANHLKVSPAQIKLLKATIDYFRPNHIGVSETLPPNSPLLQLLSHDSTCKSKPYDLFIYEQPTETVSTFISESGNWHNDSIVYMGNLRASPKGYACWKEIIRHPSVQVVLETYQAGLLFFRKEQARQHFKIRT